MRARRRALVDPRQRAAEGGVGVQAHRETKVRRNLGLARLGWAEQARDPPGEHSGVGKGGFG